MINRYSRPVMAKIWTDQNKFESYLKVEILASEAFSKLGVVPESDLEKIKKNASFDLKRIYEIEEVTRHDVVAFTRAVSETLGEEKKWIHYGLTSTDVVDTANGYFLIKTTDETYIDITIACRCSMRQGQCAAGKGTTDKGSRSGRPKPLRGHRQHTLRRQGA